MSAQDEVAALIRNLNILSTQGAVGKDEKARKEALRLSKALTAKLEDPVNAATELAFAVRVPYVLPRF